jgi:hypothetical protein
MNSKKDYIAKLNMRKKEVCRMTGFKKLYTILLSAFGGLIFFGTTPMNAQVQNLNNLNIFAGISLPVGDFSSTSGNNPGFAQLGFTGGLEYSMHLCHLYDVGILGSVALDGTDEEALRKLTTDVSSNTTGGTWVLYGVLLSAGLSGNITPVWDLHGKIYLGLVGGTSPEFNLYNINATGSYTTQKSAWSSALGYGVGCGVTINKFWDCNIRFITAEPEYNTEKTDGRQITPITFKQPSGNLTLTVGLLLN